MAIQLVCDGNCGEKIDADTKPVGRIEPAFYCPTCRVTYDEAVKDIEAERLDSVRIFSDYRTARLDLARKKLGKLPDE